jgi:sulfatase modifying factor 1
MRSRLTLALVGLLILIALPARALVSSVILQADLPQPQPVSMPITLTATAVADSAVEYKFRVGIKSGASFGWITLQDYSAATICVWTSTTPALYSLAVYARSVGSAALYERYKTIGFTISPPPLTGVSLAVSPRPVQTAGLPVELVATTEGGLNSELKFRIGYKSGTTYSWELLHDYATVPITTWTPIVPGAYLVEVTARDRGSAASAYVQTPYQVKVPSHSITGFSPMSGLVGSTVTLTGTNLTETTGVAFNGTVTTFAVDSPTSITATVPRGATSGPLMVTTSAGTAISAVPFTVATVPRHEMVWVDRSAFSMGTQYGVYWEGPYTQQVTLSGYWIDKYEVTVAQYRAFCAATERVLPPFPSGYSWVGKAGWSDTALQQHPIVNVSWTDAKAYADWAGLQLPTEAQWEYAAGGGASNYPWGGRATHVNPRHGWDQTKCANSYNSYDMGKSTWPVGSFPAGASWCGAQDLAGNVSEWCADWYGPYSHSGQMLINPTGPATGTGRVLRGATWMHGDYRAAGRNGPSRPDNYAIVIGFRCVSSAPGP